MELNSTRSYHASARAIANDCKKEIRFEKQLLRACTLLWQPSEKNVVEVKGVNLVSCPCVIVTCR